MSQITRLLLAPARLSAHGPELTHSIGVVVDDARVYWGDCHLPAATDGPPAGRVLDVMASALVGQELSDFRELCASIPAIDAATLEQSGAFIGAGQQALLAAVAATRQQTAAETLAEAYGFPAPQHAPIEVPLFLEISDFAATAERIDRMLALRPAAVGYRLTGGQVAEAIGPNAEYLQRFVRELAGRIATQADGEGGWPAIYLGLNGALGALVGDPRRQLGQVLGHCAGLQSAVGGLDLYLEDPFVLDDAIAQPALFHQLKDYCRRSSAFDKQPFLVARAPGHDHDSVSAYGDIGAVDGLVFDLAAGWSIDRLMTQLVALRGAGARAIISHSTLELVSHHWPATIADMAIAGATALLLSYDHSPNSQLATTTGRIAEVTAWLGRGNG
ncbi:protein of unknown function [Candidatus Promineifilum breve]|uniref:Uncharacterized protein n=1 Tax=Candidatus Promineifilum breve TaxID=1806508 RepID=A0A160SYQ4_9CHLR|nr:hypothetical protein [Candidatus Promineifilum breve]CUS02204.2 protein of unknown function [Candidatus Promineifilum breve]